VICCDKTIFRAVPSSAYSFCIETLDMNDWEHLSGSVGTLAPTELGRLIATILIIMAGAVIGRLLQKHARRRSLSAQNVARGRENVVLIKNIVGGICLLLIATIWAATIAGVALSLAAVAGALLLVSKEFLANILGSAMLAISRPYRVGDFIDIDQTRGRVLDTDLMVTKIAETLQGHQLTGRIAVLPNSLLLTRPVKNLTATGKYVVNLLNIVVERTENLLFLETALLSAAREVCNPWLVEANQHLQHMESIELIDLPSAEPRVLVQLDCAEETTLSLRYACRPNDQVKVEQEILRKYLRYCQSDLPHMAAA
jgi:small-conductance mechanosensitive channel